ncbi:Cytochrome bo(3) ubiquinol oxidase subunit 2 [Castellaniella defragrans]
MKLKHLRSALLLPLLLALGGCHQVLLDPSGYVARQQSDIMILTTTIIALIIVPVLIAIAIVAWRYRASNTNARYDAKWDHSPQLELIVWAVPMLIIIAVGAVSWAGTHQLDPYRPLTHVSADKPIPPGTQPLQVEVVSLRWKWLFFYPQYGIATVNELAAPVDVPIQFLMTSDTMMDSFFIPALAGQIYAMPGMQTVLHGVINQPGNYDGFSANYSGAGFTDMRFRFYGMSAQDFARWIAKARTSDKTLDRSAYDQLRKPTRAEPVHVYSHFSPDLYQRILNRCVDPGETCMSQMMAANSMHQPIAAHASAPAAATH